MGVQSYEKKMRTAKKNKKNAKEKNKKKQPDHEGLIATKHTLLYKEVSYISCPARLKEMR